MPERELVAVIIRVILPNNFPECEDCSHAQVAASKAMCLSENELEELIVDGNVKVVKKLVCEDAMIGGGARGLSVRVESIHRQDELIYVFSNKGGEQITDCPHFPEQE